MKIFKIVISVLLISLIVGVVAENISLKLDSSKYTPVGKLVEVNEKKMHVFGVGSGDNTIVLVPGYGTASPYVDFEPLWSRISNKNRVVVVERFGYGFSDTSIKGRSIANVVKEMKEALKLSGEKPPYTLVGHSLGGTISVAYAQAYPDEVSNIVMLDAPLPVVYEDWERPSQPIENILPFLKSTGLARGLTLNDNIMAALRGGQNGYKEVSKELWDLDRSLVIRNIMNTSLKSEMKLFHENVRYVNRIGYNYEIPTLFISTYDTYELLPEMESSQEEYIKKSEESRLIELDGGHYIHQYYPDEISECIVDFINNNNK